MKLSESILLPPFRIIAVFFIIFTCIYTQVAYNAAMKAVFVELPAFSRFRERYLDDTGFHRLQELLMENPEAGDVIPDSGGLRKLRFADTRRSKGKRGGLRVIFYWWAPGGQFWLFTLFNKNEAPDLPPNERRALRSMLKAELKIRSKR